MSFRLSIRPSEPILVCFESYYIPWATKLGLRRSGTDPAKIHPFHWGQFHGFSGKHPLYLMNLIQSASPPLVVTDDHSTEGGATLKRLWEKGDATRAIDAGSYDTVVIQDDIPEINIDYFKQFTRKFVGEVRSHKATPVLNMTWQYDRLGWMPMPQIIQAHLQIARELHVRVAPVGLAWQIAHQR